jgi:hypothetical protein
VQVTFGLASLNGKSLARNGNSNGNGNSNSNSNGNGNGNSNGNGNFNGNFNGNPNGIYPATDFQKASGFLAPKNKLANLIT